MFNGKRIASIVFILLILVVSILCTIGTAKGLNAFNALNGYSYSLSDELKVLHNALVVILVFVIISFVLELIAFGVSFSDYFEKKNVLILFLPIIAFSLSNLITGFMAMSSYSYDTQGAVIAEIVLEFLVLFSFLLACATEEKASCYIVAIASVFKIICLIIAMVSLSEEGLALAGDIIGLIALVFFAGFMFVAANDADYSYFRTSKTTSYSSHNYGPYRVGAIVYNKFELYDDAGVKIEPWTKLIVKNTYPDKCDLLDSLTYSMRFNGVMYSALSAVNQTAQSESQTQKLKQAEKSEPKEEKKDSNPVEKLKELKNLYDAGILTKEEYDQKKAKYIEML